MASSTITCDWSSTKARSDQAQDAISTLRVGIHDDAKANLIAALFGVTTASPTDGGFAVVFTRTGSSNHAFGTVCRTGWVFDRRNRVVVLRIKVRHPFP